ncbi:MAG: nitrate reductase associated protein [Lyngbya sp. HA4199-MV5]|jgi:hypothetical protein|nr:nitrate reductase associated protein [Lyngbya sp. HA4199-MV5]
MTEFFHFEADFVESLRCIPMQVRLKLDTCGIKLKLPQWHRMTQDDRRSLLELPCETPPEVDAYRRLLTQLVQERTGATVSTLAVDPTPPWLDTTTIPDSVQAKAQESGITIAIDQWEQLLTAERFALIKLSRSNHENANFLPALKEFHLL